MNEPDEERCAVDGGRRCVACENGCIRRHALAEGYVEEYRRMAGGAIIAPEEDPR